tara:strand:- start:5 stop:283 length:279 start_codon:yes stop_codon:yes gene_type:complete
LPTRGRDRRRVASAIPRRANAGINSTHVRRLREIHPPNAPSLGARELQRAGYPARCLPPLRVSKHTHEFRGVVAGQETLARVFDRVRLVSFF